MRKLIFVIFLLISTLSLSKEYTYQNKEVNIKLLLLQEHKNYIKFKLFIDILKDNSKLTYSGKAYLISSSEIDEDIYTHDAYHAKEYWYQKHNKCSLSIRIDDEEYKRVFLEFFNCRKKIDLSNKMLKLKP
ncbi:hypothetical protein RO21_05300 [[Actinobacillus] muris]|uniref:Uncharacterized protein n=1 Tax=Muribacter muris TaxID=67855 RepID=A0A0J5P5Q8_9PAST|nr:hypothetical protein [Muribacter muris]KMK51601.1 hypothetical protein RO21_05300 [[Actinobacillus] muris] [Muribacter muris]